MHLETVHLKFTNNCKRYLINVFSFHQTAFCKNKKDRKTKRGGCALQEARKWSRNDTNLFIRFLQFEVEKTAAKRRHFPLNTSGAMMHERAKTRRMVNPMSDGESPTHHKLESPGFTGKGSYDGVEAESEACCSIYGKLLKILGAVIAVVIATAVRSVNDVKDIHPLRKSAGFIEIVRACSKGLGAG